MSVQVDSHLYTAVCDLTCPYDCIHAVDLRAGPSDRLNGRSCHMVVTCVCDDFCAEHIYGAIIDNSLPCTFLFSALRTLIFPQLLLAVPYLMAHPIWIVIPKIHYYCLPMWVWTGSAAVIKHEPGRYACQSRDGPHPHIPSVHATIATVCQERSSKSNSTCTTSDRKTKVRNIQPMYKTSHSFLRLTTKPLHPVSLTSHLGFALKTQRWMFHRNRSSRSKTAQAVLPSSRGSMQFTQTIEGNPNTDMTR